MKLHIKLLEEAQDSHGRGIDPDSAHVLLFEVGVSNRHAGGRGFESRRLRQNKKRAFNMTGALFYFYR